MKIGIGYNLRPTSSILQKKYVGFGDQACSVVDGIEIPCTGRTGQQIRTLFNQFGDVGYDAFCESIPRGGAGLDLGAGRSTFFEDLSKLRPDLHLVKFDPVYAEPVFWETNEKSTLVSYVAGDARELPFPDESFDLIFTSNLMAFFHKLDRMRAAKQIYYKTKLGGQAIVTPVYNVRSLPRTVKRLERPLHKEDDKIRAQQFAEDIAMNSMNGFGDLHTIPLLSKR
jgi:hypothetical protein